jgi:hypothetical protein
MNPSSDNYGFIPTLTLLQAVRAAVAAITLPAPFSGAAFAETRLYAHENLTQALRDLLVFEDRVCLIIPTAARHENTESGRFLQCRRETEFALLVCDRVYGGQFDAEAALGNADTPGMIALAELTIGALAGQSLDLPSVCLKPGAGEPFRLTSAERDEAPGRECWAQTFTTSAGEVRVDRRAVIPSRPFSPFIA